MSSSIIKVQQLSKSFTINHEGKERYTALRDVVTDKAKKIFSFPTWMKPQQLTVTKETFWALKDVDFTVERGDRLGIIGRNGAGKSTLLKILSRITEPTSGSVSINGRVASLLEVGTGFHPELTGRENIFLNGAILGMGRQEIRKKFDEIIAFAEVEQFLDTPVKRYSSGMYVRLAFAVAAHLEPEILIVDEVLAVGDAQFQKKCLGKMQDVSSGEGRTVLFVSHNMGVVSQLCNKGILLQKGQVVFNGGAKQAIESYLQSQTQHNDYTADNSVILQKKNYIQRLVVKNKTGEPTSNFSFDENISLHFELSISNYSPNLQIGIGLLDKYNNRIFTLIKEMSYFLQPGHTIASGSLTLPKELIAPNYYNFVVAVWTKDGRVHDIVENVCPVTIHDNGTDFAHYEGVDYGSVIVAPDWQTN